MISYINMCIISWKQLTARVNQLVEFHVNVFINDFIQSL